MTNFSYQQLPVTVFMLWHTHEFEDGTEDNKLIGSYSSKQRALDALERVIHQPGFKDFPEGFQISAVTLDQDHWTEGFIREE